MNAEESRLVERFKGGDPEAFRMLYEAQSGRILRYLTHLLRSRERADEVLQATWTLAVAHRESLRRPEKVGPWLLRIAHREALRILGQDRWRVPPAPRGVGEDPSSPVRILIQKEDEDLIRRILNELPLPCRELLWLSVVEELSNEQIAEILRIPVGTSRSRLHYAILKLEEALKSRGGMSR